MQLKYDEDGRTVRIIFKGELCLAVAGCSKNETCSHAKRQVEGQEIKCIDEGAYKKI